MYGFIKNNSLFSLITVSLVLLLLLPGYCKAPKIILLSSPDKSIILNVQVSLDKRLVYSVKYRDRIVLSASRLGLIRADGDFSNNLSILFISKVEQVVDRYTMVYAKRKHNIYKANKITIHLQNENHQKIDVIFQLSNDGVAFRYYFPETSADIKRVTGESTSFHFSSSAKAWLQPMQLAKSGWEHSNPAYEENYEQGIAVGTPAPTEAGWVYPALFNDKDNWVLITEASVDSNYCASRLEAESAGGEYKVGFPSGKEVFTGKGHLPQSRLPFYSPWRIVTIGSLKTIVESTLGTDLARPSVIASTGFIKPGKASWSWINSKDDSIVYSEQKRYVDFASNMRWKYCLVDADWDRKIGYDKIQQLAGYAKRKDVGLLLWYNSAGDWNTVKYAPKNRLLTHESRQQEFSRLKQMGIKGVKIDFFGGDGQSMIKYYIDILNDAAQYQLLVNFHGATLPRGWSRTYPNLLSTEAVKGFEMVTFNQADADRQANHCAMLPFTRNVFDPMDFTPMNLYKIPTNVKRRTTSTFELALPVIFLSGIQHLAESPSGMAHVPEKVRQFLRELPDTWDEVKYIDGYPGKYVVLARRSGNSWYIAGINGENAERSITFNISRFKGRKKMMISDRDGEELFDIREDKLSSITNQQTIKMKAAGGFVMVISQ